jgi:hypothetical protein
MAELCRATARAGPPEALAETSELLGREVEKLYEWINSAVSALASTGDTHTPELIDSEQQAEDSLHSLIARLPSAESPSSSGDTVWEVTGLKISYRVPESWLLTRSDFETVLLAPPEYQRFDEYALGPSPRPNGSAVRIWTVQRPGSYDQEDATRDSSVLLSRYGSPEAVERIDIAGVEGKLHLVENAATGWRITLAVFAALGRGIFLEAVCPLEMPDCTREAEEVLYSLRVELIS